MGSPLVDSVDCPYCGGSVAVSLPRSASVVDVTHTADGDLEVAVDGDRRLRRLAYECPVGHATFVYFEW